MSLDELNKALEVLFEHQFVIDQAILELRIQIETSQQETQASIKDICNAIARLTDCYEKLVKP